MSATIDIEPKLLERLQAKAQERGQDVNDLLRAIIDEIEASPILPQDFSLEEMHSDLEALAEGTEHLPPLPETFSRQDIYFDHD